MKAYRITVIILLSIIELYCGYATIGYLVEFCSYPHLAGETNSYFLGMLMMSGLFLLLLIPTTILLVIYIKKLIKNHKTK